MTVTKCVSLNYRSQNWKLTGNKTHTNRFCGVQELFLCEIKESDKIVQNCKNCDKIEFRV